MIAAVKQWTLAPVGRNVHEVYLRLRAEAIARGELDVEAERLT